MITLGVEDIERSVKFYRDGLGFPQLESPPEVAFFTLNGTWLGLYGREALAEDARNRGAKDDHPDRLAERARDCPHSESVFDNFVRHFVLQS